MHEHHNPEVAAVAAALARALDADDFVTVRSLLADDCVYETGRETLRGPEAIVSSYAGASAWARRALDEVRYASEVAPAAGAEVTVTFTDYLFRAGGGWHRHRCRQTFTVSGGRVARIVHDEIEGEREALDAYFRACGIER
jgi:hypothetical protein